MANKLLLIGGGGHCRSVIDCVLSLGKYDDIGIVDNVDCSYQGITTVGTDDDLKELFHNGWGEAFITVGSIGDPTIRKRLFALIKDIGFEVPVIIDPSAIVAKDTLVREGVFVGKNSVINTGVVIDNCGIINTGSIIEHDCSIGAFSHISPGAVLCGEVKVGTDSHIGAGTVVKQNVVVGNSVLVGAGSVLLSNLPDGVIAYGNPCKVVD